MEMFGRAAKFINHLSFISDLCKDLNDDRHTAVDKQAVSTKPTRNVAMGYLWSTPH